MKRENGGIRAVLGGKYLGSSSCLRKPTQFKLIFKRGEFALDVDIGKAERWAGNVRSLLKGDLPPSFFFLFFSRSSCYKIVFLPFIWKEKEKFEKTARWCNHPPANRWAPGSRWIVFGCTGQHIAANKREKHGLYEEGGQQGVEKR